MNTKKKPSLYQMVQKYSRESKNKTAATSIDLAGTVRRLRDEKNLSGVDLCKRAGDLNPKTLTAVEKGRIQNPSIQTLLSIARGLGVSVGDLFRQAEMDLEQYFSIGSQKGSFQIDFLRAGVKIVSFTPFMKDFFCGKWIVAAQQLVDGVLFQHPHPFFMSTLVGRFEFGVEGRKTNLKEGENIFFSGQMRYSFYNPLHRESVLLVVTAPSFL